MSRVNVWVVKRKRKSGFSYAIQWIDDRTGKVRTEACGTDKAYARQKAAERRKELLSGLYREVRFISYDDFVEEHLSHIKGVLSDGSWEEHERVLRQFKEVCHPRDMTAIDYNMLEKFRKARVADAISPYTVNKYLRTLQSILARAVRRGYAKVNPFIGNRKALWVAEPEPTPKILAAGDYQKIVAACPDDRWRAICAIAYYAGLRKGEIVSLEWDDIDFDNNILHVRNKENHLTKSRKIRSIPMAQQIVQALRKLLPGVFQSRYVCRNAAGNQIRNNFHRAFQKIVTRAGLLGSQGEPAFSIHDLRRSCATELLRQGVPPKTAQKIMGHADLSTTMKYYCGVQDQDLRDAIAKLEARTA